MNRKDSTAEPRGPISRTGLVLAAAVAMSAAGIGWEIVGSKQAQPAPQPIPPIPVQTTDVTPQTVEITRTGLGTVLAWNTAVIQPQVSGPVMDLPFTEGRAVKAADVLVRIDPRPFQDALDQTNAKLAEDQANQDNAQKNLSRDETLLTKGGFATRQTVDNERAQVESNQATIAGDQAAVKSAALNLSYATIVAPISGIVGLRNIDLGSIVTPATTILTITQVEPIAVDFTLPQVDLAAVQAAAAVGQPAVTAFDQDEKTLLAKGALDVINNQVDTASGTIRLKARFENKDHKLWPGEFVQIQIVVEVLQNAIVVPSEAVQRGPDGPFVWAVSKNQMAQLRPIEIRDIEGQNTVVGRGIALGERIVVSGQYRLKPGSPVTETKPQTTSPAPRSVS
jgi:membrane fusion protein, multidrug efflux system